MSTPWYVYVIIGLVVSLLLWVCNKFQILKFIKSKALREFIAIFVFTFICWIIYDNVIAPE